MGCPKCGTENAAGVWVCARCDYILDPSFLGDDILNEAARAALGDATAIAVAPAIPAVRDASDALPSVSPDAELPPYDPDEWDFGGDSVILGRLEDAGGESVLSSRTGSFAPVDPGAPSSVGPVSSVFIGSDVARLLQPGSVPRRAHDAAQRQHVLTSFERTVFDLVDGRSSLEALRLAADFSENDMRIAMAMLLDKAMVEIDVADADFLEDATRELEHLPPLASPSLADAEALEPALSPFDLGAASEDAGTSPARVAADLPSDAMMPLPLPVVAPPPQPPPPQPPPRPPLPAVAPPTPTSAAADAAALEIADGLRPAMRASPVTALPKKRPSDIVERASAPIARSPGAGAAGLPGANAPAPPVAPAGAKARAAELYEMCMKDLHAGRVGRAWGYAKMALDADPEDPALKALLNDWNKTVAALTAGGARPQTPQELLAASQKAEQEGDFERAIAHMKTICEMAKGSASAHNRLGVLLATRSRDFHAGYNAAMRAVELEPNNMTYQSNMMKILTKLDSADKRGKGDAKKGGLLGKVLNR